MTRILIFLAAVAAPCLASAQGWATFYNCGATTEPPPAQQAGDGCALAELPEHSESGDPVLACRSEHSPGKPDLLARVYSSASGQRAYIYADGRYEKTILAFFPIDCDTGAVGPRSIGVSEYVYLREQQRPAAIELSCSADGQVEFFRIQR